MPFPLFNSIASWFLKKRIHQIELFLKYPVEVQQEVLMDLISFAKNTKMGYQHDFNSIKNYTEFKERVPIRSYEEIAEDINKSREGEDNLFWPTKIKWYAKSSGTTDSRSKFIPVSTEALEDCHYKAGKDMLSLYINNNTNTQLFTGKSLRLGGSQELHQNQQNYFGDLSSIIIDNMPLWAEINSTPSMRVSLMPDWDSKIKAILNECLSENVTSLVGVPSWMLVLLNQGLSKMNKSDIFEIWPNVEVYFHGGVSFRPYKNQYNQIFSRDIAFVIDDQLIVPNILEDRAMEYDALMPFVKQIRPEFIKKMPPSAYAEGGDVILDKEYIFVGVSDAQDFKKYTVARTNYEGVSFLEQTFPHRKIKSFELNKSDLNSYDNALHLDCCFQPIGSGMAILYSGGFKHDEDVAFIVNHYGKQNIIEITKEEMYHMNSNIFSISPKVIVSNDALTRLNSTLRQKGFMVEEIPYSEVSKMGGLLRCSTLPLRRKYHD